MTLVQLKEQTPQKWKHVHYFVCVCVIIKKRNSKVISVCGHLFIAHIEERTTA